MRWNNLHYQYRKESRRPGGSTWPYFKRLQFLTDAQSRPKAKAKVERQPNVVQKESFVDQGTWQSYEDCVVMHVTDMEQHDDNTLIIEEIIEPSDPMLQEEIIFEEADEVVEQHLQPSIEATAKGRAPLAVDASPSSPTSAYLQMSRILGQLKGVQKVRAERRILAFLLKCQLRALVDEPINDLVI